jgi:signal transduction histidine kinase
MQAQLRLLYDGKELAPAATSIQVLFDCSTTFSNEGLQQLLPQQWQPVNDLLPQMSYARFNTWLRIPLQQVRMVGTPAWLAISNPHINHLRLWLVQNNRIQHAFPLTGDAFPFNSRALPTRSFLFPLQELNTDSGYLVLAADKKLSKLELPLHFQSNAYFVSRYEADSKGILFFLGFVFFLFLFNSYLFISTGESVFSWYIAYLFLISLYVCIDAGLLFQYVYPQYPQINDIIRPASFALSIVPMLLFFNRILQVRTHAPGLFTLNKWMCGIYLLLFVAAVGSSALTKDAALQNTWLQINRLVTPLVLLVLLSESLYFLYKGHTIAAFSLGSFFALIFFSLVYVALQLNWLQPSLFSSYSLYWGLAADTIFMGLSLAWRFRLFRHTMEKLIQEKKNRQEQITMELSSWKEQQMQQFSSLLHDRIGALIAILRLSVDNMELNEKGRRQVVNDVVAIANEVRQYSHSFSPLTLRQNGLKSATAALLQKLRENSHLQIQFEWIGSEKIVPDQLSIILYLFLQEIMQNMLKHANCTQAILQVINDPSSVYLYFEDNGKGCEQIDFKKGIGLQSMQRIIGLLGGTFEASSRAGEGFSLSMQFTKSY